MFLYIYYKCRNNHHDTYTVDKLQLNSTSNSNHNHRLVDFFSIVALIIFFLFSVQYRERETHKSSCVKT